MKNSAFCYLHALGRVRRVPWRKNPTVHVSLAIVALVFSIYVYWTGPTAARQEEVLQDTKQTVGNTQEILHDTKRTVENTDEIRRILETITDYDQKRRAELTRRFPLGYILFGARQREVFIPYTSRLTRDFDVSLEGASLHLTPDEVMVMVPKILDREREIYLHDFGVGATRQVGFRKPAVNQFGLEISLAVLADYGSSVVCALGFSESSPRR